jgi:NAD-dependent deacetylase
MSDATPRLVVMTGAGLSAPSGISTFRDKDGLWNEHSIDQVCNALTWRDNRDAVHRFYNMLRTSLPKASPNPGHDLLSAWSKDYGEKATILTQNVDDLLERAGCNNAIHLHGYLQNMQCIACGNVWNVGYSEWDHETDRCPDCNSARGVKPGVVFFNERAPRYSDLYRAFKKLTSRDVVVVIGTSGQVINVDALAIDCRAFKILNNLEPMDEINDGYFD